MKQSQRNAIAELYRTLLEDERARWLGRNYLLANAVHDRADGVRSAADLSGDKALSEMLAGIHRRHVMLCTSTVELIRRSNYPRLVKTRLRKRGRRAAPKTRRTKAQLRAASRMVMR